MGCCSGVLPGAGGDSNPSLQSAGLQAQGVVVVLLTQYAELLLASPEQ